MWNSVQGIGKQDVRLSGIPASVFLENQVFSEPVGL